MSQPNRRSAEPLCGAPQPALLCAEVPLESEKVFVCSKGVNILFTGVAEAALASVLQRRPLAGWFVS